jgi:hypothetical protein
MTTLHFATAPRCVLLTALRRWHDGRAREFLRTQRGLAAVTRFAITLLMLDTDVVEPGTLDPAFPQVEVQEVLRNPNYSVQMIARAL